MSWLSLDGPGAKRLLLVRRIAHVWLLLLIAGSLQPKRPISLAGFHREIHWLAFAGAAFLLLVLARNLQEVIQRVLAALLLGVSLEILQHFLYHKTIEWLDVSDDALAILVALALYWLAAKPVIGDADRP